MAMTILLVEPEGALREEVCAVLRGEGHRLWAFGNAGGAMESLNGDLPQLALLGAGPDPHMDRLLERLRQDGGRTQVVWVAAPGLDEVERLAEERHPRGLLARKGLADQVVELARRVSQTRERNRVLVVGPPMLGESPPMVAMQALIDRIAEGGAPNVLVTGESGTGKEVAARRIHALGPRAGGPFVEVDCASIPENLMESELFGHEAGAFTDAREAKTGLLELAQGGTVFLDEIGELDLGLQAKLLRVLDTRRLRRLGGRDEIPLDAHVVAATNRDLETEVHEGRFRADLFYRLDVVRVVMPPLRDRGEDVALLAARFLEDSCRRLGRPGMVFSAEAGEAMLRYPWPGNVRELRNHIERLALLAPPELKVLEDAGLAVGTPRARLRLQIDFSGGPIPWEEIERAALLEAMHAAEGNVSEAARLLHLGRGALRYRLARHGMSEGGDLEDDRQAA
jgi:DNA-binding NtrC family response regulator